MKKIVLLVGMFLSFLIVSCATVDRTEIETVKKGPQVSKTIKHEQKKLSDMKGLKRKVAIARFSNETKYGQSFFIDKNHDRIGKQAVDILSAKLVETDKFILLERVDMDKINKELQMENYQPLKNMADYLIVGSVTEFGRETRGKVGIFSRTKRQAAFAKVHIRLIDVRTGQIIYAEEGKGEAFSEAGSVFGVGERAGYDSTINDKALEAAITDLASNIIERLLDRPWRSYLLGYEDGKLIIAGGKTQNIKIGQKFKVMREGKKVKNPQTNMMITLPGKKIATIEVAMLAGDTPETEISLCDIIEGDLSSYIKSQDFQHLYIQESN